MKSRFTIAGHPIHPFMVLFPVGLFAWAFISNIVFAVNDEPIWYDISFWSTWAALIAAALASISGIGDYLSVARYHVPATGMAHMLLNAAVAAAFLAAGILMLDQGAIDGGGRLTLALVLQGVGVVLLAVSGWLGGEMVYRHGMAVTPEAAREIEESSGHARGARPAGQPR